MSLPEDNGKIRTVKIREFRLESIHQSCTMIMVGPPGSGKTNFIEAVCYCKKDKYPVAGGFFGSEEAYERFSEIFHSLFVHNQYDEQALTRMMERQKTVVHENRLKSDPKGAVYLGNACITILDDVSDNPKIFKQPVMRGIFKTGSRHYKQIFMLGSQYAIDMPPDVRNSASYVVLFRQPEEGERKKLYTNFGGICGSYENFCDLMDQLTGDFTALIISKNMQTNELEECVFYLKAPNMSAKGKWKFGCEEYRRWGDKYYNQNYQEDFSA